MVLGMQLKFLYCLECQTTLVAAIFVDMTIRDRQLGPFIVDLIEVHLKGIGGFKDFVTALFPAKETGGIISCRLLFLKKRLASFSSV